MAFVKLQNLLKNNIPISAGFAFVALIAVFLTLEQFWFLGIPIILFIAYLGIFKMDFMLMMVAFLTPFSVNMENLGMGMGVILPTEPLLAGILLLMIFKIVAHGYPKKILSHPVTIAILINLLWIFITVLTSSEPIVSLKFLIARLWFVIPFYFFGVLLFANTQNVHRYLWAYSIPLIGVVIYTLVRHASYGMSEDPAHWVMDPFFKDHTSYGAILAMFFPVLIGMFIIANRKRQTFNVYFLALFIFIMALGIVFSYTRAAWISLLGALCLLLTIKLKIKFTTILTSVVVLVVLFFSVKDMLLIQMQQNKQASSDSLTEHVQSITNISNDDSNLERINRWSSAFRMFRERPLFGWGPGTYQFKYAPFQLSTEKTLISTNAGDLGNAHSEYIGPLAESGLLGMLSVVGVIITILYTGISLYPKIDSFENKVILMSVLLGFFTYVIHAFLNNFLDTDKASIPFWGFAAIMVMFDNYYKEKSQENKL